LTRKYLNTKGELLYGADSPSRILNHAAFQQELLSFPAGKHDDMVDALGLIGQMLNQLFSGAKPIKCEDREYQRGYAPANYDADPKDWKAWF